MTVVGAEAVELVETPLLPPGYVVPRSRFVRASSRLRELLRTHRYVVGPGVSDPIGAMMVMYQGFKVASYQRSPLARLQSARLDPVPDAEVAEGWRRTVSALRKFQLMLAVGDAERGIAPKHVDTPPIVADLDGARADVFDVQHVAELCVTAGIAGAHLDDGRRGRRPSERALAPASETIARLRMARVVADDLGDPDFVLVARTCAAADDAGGLDEAVERGLRYFDTGVPDLLWCDAPAGDVGVVARFTAAVRRRFPDARFACAWPERPERSGPNAAELEELAHHGVALVLTNADSPQSTRSFASGDAYYELVGRLYGAGADDLELEGKPEEPVD